MLLLPLDFKLQAIFSFSLGVSTYSTLSGRYLHSYIFSSERFFNLCLNLDSLSLHCPTPYCWDHLKFETFLSYSSLYKFDTTQEITPHNAYLCSTYTLILIMFNSKFLHLQIHLPSCQLYLQNYYLAS
jgi:hypothetical protein